MFDRSDPALIERFESKVDRSGECHRWTACRNVSGYGQFSLDGKIRPAHVVALLLAGVDVPPGMTVDHVWARGCTHKDCVRVEHLEVVTRRENILRSNVPAAINARKMHCHRGHRLLAKRRDGRRVCAPCKQEDNANYERTRTRRRAA